MSLCGALGLGSLGKSSSSSCMGVSGLPGRVGCRGDGLVAGIEVWLLCVSGWSCKWRRSCTVWIVVGESLVWYLFLAQTMATCRASLFFGISVMNVVMLDE